MTRKKIFIWALALLVVAILVASTEICLPLLILHGIATPECPDGRVVAKAQVQMNGLRGHDGQITVSALGYFTTGPSDRAESADYPRFKATAQLLGADKKEIPLALSNWKKVGRSQQANFKVPSLPDGEYTLVAKIHSSLGGDVVELPLAFFAPALVHLITDRPLYQPGDTVRFRAVVVRARDRLPLEGRPGRFVVIDPSGEALLEQRSPAGAYGVAAGQMPLDRAAASGVWRVRWVSGEASEEQTFQVEPFVLPRFVLETEIAKPHYGANERPVVRGSVRYSSGAPVAGASLQITWQLQDTTWPMPLEWTSSTGSSLPEALTADAQGRFELELPTVPADLRGRAKLVASIAATDQVGDRVNGSAAVLLSEHPIQVDFVSELPGGLVEGFNNRLYLRATTPSGSPLAKTALTVRRTWDPNDPGIRAETDLDGVAALQLDPGPAVNVVVPAMPVRSEARAAAVTLEQALDLVRQEEPSLDDQLVLERWPKKLASCARFVEEESQPLPLGVQVGSAGQILFADGGRSALGVCAATIAEKERFSAGPLRLFDLQFSFRDSELPRISMELRTLTEHPGSPEDDEGEGPYTDGFDGSLDIAARDARSCLLRDTADLPLPRLLVFWMAAKQKKPTLSWIPDPAVVDDETLKGPAVACIEARISKIELRRPAIEANAGVVSFAVGSAGAQEQADPGEDTTRLGYELMVSAASGQEEIGSTPLFIPPGAVPPLRLRASKVIVEPGDPLEVQLIRGPGYNEALPKKLYLVGPEGTIAESELDPAKKTVSFTLPKNAEGWYQVEHFGARALVFVASKGGLSLELLPDRPRYAPGELAQLSIQTRIKETAVPAAVGLFGVDKSLAQLAPLPGVDSFERLLPKVKTPSPAFGVLDGTALLMGRIRGENAAAATVLRVTELPPAAAIDGGVGGYSAGAFDPVAVLTDRFFSVLAEVHRQVRQWEESAQKDEQMTNAQMAATWTAALAACRSRGERVDDAFGRPLRLSRLPADLLAQTAPREVVLLGTRLPEDVEDWATFVRKERP